MDFNVAHRTILAGLQVFHDATFTDCGAERRKDSFIFNLTTLTAKFRPLLVNWLEAVYTFRDKAAASSIPVRTHMCANTLLLWWHL